MIHSRIFPRPMNNGTRDQEFSKGWLKNDQFPGKFLDRQYWLEILNIRIKISI